MFFFSSVIETALKRKPIPRPNYVRQAQVAPAQAHVRNVPAAVGAENVFWKKYNKTKGDPGGH